MMRLLETGVVGKEGLRTAEGMEMVAREFWKGRLRVGVVARGNGHADGLTFRGRAGKWAKVVGCEDGTISRKIRYLQMGEHGAVLTDVTILKLVVTATQALSPVTTRPCHI